MVGENSTARSGISDFRKDTADDKENLWTKILGEVQSSNSNKLSTCKSLLVLGDNESGKTTLIAKLQGNEDPKKGKGLEYAYIEVRDEYRDEKTRLGVWVMDGEPKHSDLLEFAIKEKNFEHTLVILAVSMTTPWGIMDQLHMWATMLQDHTEKLLDTDTYLNHQKKMVRTWQDYVEPGDELDGTSAMKRSSKSLENGDDIPLPETVLTRNLGLDVLVVVTKTDYMSTLEKDFDFKEEHFDFIQQSIRKFCLQYGASLFYTSVKEDKNCDLLYKYLVHKIYGFPFKTPALVVEKDAVFIPNGWDNEKKISILYENMHNMSPNDYYTDAIVKPPVARKTITREVEIQAEDENAFLSRHFAMMQNSGPGGAPTGGISQSRSDGPHRQTPTAARRAGGTTTASPVTTTANASPQIAMTAPKKIDATKPGMTSANEGVLANFFNALLSKKSGALPQSPSNRVNSISRSDAVAELDRLSCTKTPDDMPTPDNEPPPTNTLIVGEAVNANNNPDHSLNNSTEC